MRAVIGKGSLLAATGTKKSSASAASSILTCVWRHASSLTRNGGDGGVSSSSSPPSSSAPTAGGEDDDDPAVLLRRLQTENAAKAAAMAHKNATPPPPAPARRSGKTNFFTDGQDKTAPPTRDTATSAAAAAGEQNAKSEASSEGKPILQKKKTSSIASSSSATTTTTTTTTAAAGGRPSSSSTSASTSNIFMSKVNKMEEASRLPSFPTYDAAAESRRKNVEQKIKEERRSMLVFRDVGMDLDKPILSRDVFLIYKYFRYGIEFAVDNELERMLRYFNEHAVNELKIIQDSKLMRGPPTLSRKRSVASPSSATARRSLFPSATANGRNSSHAAGGVVTASSEVDVDPSSSLLHPAEPAFQVISSFPNVRCAPLRQYCAPAAPSAMKTLHDLLKPSTSTSAFGNYLKLDADAGTDNNAGRSSARVAFKEADDAQFTVLAPSTFRRPAVVIFSQLGQKFGSEGDAQWRRLAYKSICPALVQHLPDPTEAKASTNKNKSAVDDCAAAAAGGLRKPRNSSAAGNNVNMPIDVISLRSTDIYKYKWVHSLYIRRFAQSLSTTQSKPNNNNSDEEQIANALAMSSTFVGPRLLEPFYQALGLRNYLLPHAMLVDHEGVVRWLSGGCPDAYEERLFPSLLKQLETEYYKSKSHAR